MPSWALFGLILVIGMLTTELGSFFGRRKFNSGQKVAEAPLGTAVSAVLGLLAFMLGFTFSITAARFSERKGLVISHANAIGVTYLRAGLLPEKQKTAVRKLLSEYTDIMLKLQQEGEIEKMLDRREAIHTALWEQTVSLEKEDLDSEIRSLFISSVNEIIQLSEERKTVGLIFMIPNALWNALFLLMAMSMFAFGYQTGINGSRHTMRFPLLPVAFGLVIVLIADMDSIGFGRFQVSQEPIKNLQKMIRKTSPENQPER